MSYILDIIPGAIMAYSVRKLRAGYTGAAIRVRRYTDDVEIDIGFSGNDLDVALLLQFTGSSNAYIAAWYDQSGNDLHMTQNVTAYQPLIVLNGILYQVNNKPAIYHGGTSYRLSRDAVNLGLSNTVMGVARFDIYGCEWVGYQNNIYTIYQDAVRTYSSGLNGTYFQGNNNVTPINTQLLLEVHRDNLDVETYGNNLSANNSRQGSLNPNTIINNLSGEPGYGITGYEQEVLIFPSDKRSVREILYSNISDYYNMTNPFKPLNKSNFLQFFK